MSRTGCNQSLFELTLFLFIAEQLSDLYMLVYVALVGFCPGKRTVWFGNIIAEKVYNYMLKTNQQCLQLGWEDEDAD